MKSYLTFIVIFYVSVDDYYLKKIGLRDFENYVSNLVPILQMSYTSSK